MSHKRRDQLTVSGEWATHLRPVHKRAFWKAERSAFRKFACAEGSASTQRGLRLSPWTVKSRGTGLYDSHTMPVRVHDLISRLEADGWVLVRQKGSHRQYHHAAKPGTVTVAGKPSIEIPPGTLSSILKQAGLKK